MQIWRKWRFIQIKETKQLERILGFGWMEAEGRCFFFLAWELAWKVGPSWFWGKQFDFILTERHTRIGEIEWAFWAATSFGLAFKNVGKIKKKKRRRRWPEKKKRKEGLNLKEQHVWAKERIVLGWKKMFLGWKKGQHVNWKENKGRKKRNKRRRWTETKGGAENETRKKKKRWNKKKRRKGRRWTEQRLNRKEGRRWTGRLNEIFWAFFFLPIFSGKKKNDGEFVYVEFNF